MTTYTLKLVSGVNYNLYNGATLVSDSDLATLFGSAGSAFFVFDFDGGTPTNTTSLTIVDSNSTAVITNTGLSGIAENTNFNGDWSASATAFDTFVKSPAAVLDEAQMSDLMGKIKGASASGTQTINLTTNTTAWSLFGGTGAENKIFLVNNTAGDIRKISFTSSSSESATNKVISFSNGASMFFLFSKARYDQCKFLAFEPVDKTLCTGSYSQNLSNPQLTRITVDVENTLTSTETIKPLSANQGRVLNNNISTLSNTLTARVTTNAGAPTTSTVGTVGQILEDTTNGKLYICTDATNPYVWEEVGAGGGGIQNALIIREWS